jgi:hypothetical protein
MINDLTSQSLVLERIISLHKWFPIRIGIMIRYLDFQSSKRNSNPECSKLVHHLEPENMEKNRQKVYPAVGSSDKSSKKGSGVSNLISLGRGMTIFQA